MGEGSRSEFDDVRISRKGEEVFSIVPLPGTVSEYLFQFLEITAAPHQLQTDSGGVDRLIQLVRFLDDGVLIFLTDGKLLRCELLVSDRLFAVIGMNAHIKLLDDVPADRDHLVEIEDRDELVSVIYFGEILIVVHILVLRFRRTERHAVFFVVADHNNAYERTSTFTDLRRYGHDVIVNAGKVSYVFDINQIELQTRLFHGIPFNEKGCDGATAFDGFHLR